MLGIFNTHMHHSTTKIPAVSNGWIYDLDQYNHTSTIEEQWFPFWIQNESDFFPLPKHVRILPMIMLVCHIAISYILISLMIGEKKCLNRRAAVIDQMLQSLWTVVCPPLFFDWEELYRQSKPAQSIRECWNKSWKILMAFIALFTIEHFILCCPLFVFRVSHIDIYDLELISNRVYFSLMSSNGMFKCPQSIHSYLKRLTPVKTSIR